MPVGLKLAAIAIAIGPQFVQGLPAPPANPLAPRFCVKATEASAAPICFELRDDKTYDGGPFDPKTFEAQQEKLRELLQHRAEDARKKREADRSGPPQP